MKVGGGNKGTERPSWYLPVPRTGLHQRTEIRHTFLTSHAGM